jgi:hypothetical protein
MLQPLTSPEAFWGGAEIRPGRPRTARLRNVLYLPRRGGAVWGLYDTEGRIIADAVDRAGPENRPVGQPTEPVAAPAAAERVVGDHLYIGRAQLHYGHFLVETLARCWPLQRGARGRKLIVHGADLQRAWGGWQGHAFAADILGVLGFGPADVVHFDAPAWLASVEVAQPAIQQQAFAYPSFRELCLHIGKAAMRAARGGLRLGALERAFGLAAGRRRGGRPVWLSRSAVYSGTMRVRNEVELEARLAELGFDVVHPEQLAFAAQVELFESREVVCGLASSAFHTAIFSSNQPRRLVLGVDPVINSNLQLFDGLTGRASEYFWVDDAVLLEDLGPAHGGTPEQPFTRTYAFADPKALAEAIAELAGR